jgi:hypothetical protein
MKCKDEYGAALDRKGAEGLFDEQLVTPKS